ncbi:MAG: short-chain dehydrogenase, partial [Ignavibacteria bacterium]|nr:short-chain dehydrogenase [Ignavibacteria bacterium]
YTVARTPEHVLAEVTRRIITENVQLRAQIISIGIPILLTDGKSLLRGNTIKIPPFRGKPVVRVTGKNIDRWAHDGWVDLRVANMRVWRKRFQSIISMVENLSDEETSSQTMYDRQYWKQLADIDPGKICGWIFSFEEQGRRMKA